MNTKELITFFEGIEKKVKTDLEAARTEIKKAHDLNIKTLFAQKRKELEDGLKALESQAKTDLEASLTKFSDVATKVYDSVIPPKPVAAPTPVPVASTPAPEAQVAPTPTPAPDASVAPTPATPAT